MTINSKVLAPDGTPVVGTIKFQPISALAVKGDTLYDPEIIYCTLAPDGSFSVKLCAGSYQVYVNDSAVLAITVLDNDAVATLEDVKTAVYAKYVAGISPLAAEAATRQSQVAALQTALDSALARITILEQSGVGAIGIGGN